MVTDISDPILPSRAFAPVPTLGGCSFPFTGVASSWLRQMYAEVRRALQMLHEVDSVLEQLAIFWANSEVRPIHHSIMLLTLSSQGFCHTAIHTQHMGKE